VTRQFTLAFAALLLAACGGGDDAASAPADTGSGEDTVNAETPSPAGEDTAEAADSAPDTPGADDMASSGAEKTDAPSEDARLATPEFSGLPAPYATADYDIGKRTFRLCSSCHLLEEGAGHRIGPNLHGLFERKVGGVDDFAYSDALLEADFDWTPQKLEEWLADPRGFLPGNRMSFAGVRRERDRHAVIAYIMKNTGYESSRQADTE